jgi:hypothetical protein
MKAEEILDTEFLPIRAHILEVAAALDRIDRADGDVSSDDRLQLIQQALRLTTDSNDPSRAEQMQLLFSRDYDPAWRETFKLSGDQHDVS